MRNYLITGAGGFLGTALLSRLANKDGVTVFAFTFDFERERDTFVRAGNIIPVDNSEAESFDYSKIDVIINCAFPRNADSDKIAAGLDFLAAVVKNSAEKGTRSFINISSQSVYSTLRTEPAKETDALVLETKYAIGKYASELLVNAVYGKTTHTNIRMASLIGPGFDQRVPNKMIDFALSGNQLSALDDEQYFGYVDISDACDGILSVAELAPEKWKEVYNLGSDRTYTLKDIAGEVSALFKREMGKDIAVETTPGDKKLNSSLDCSRLNADTGFCAGVSLGDSLKKILDRKLSNQNK